MRLFVSIDPSREVRLQLSQWLPELKELRKTAQEQLHLTLLFLGDQSGDAVSEIQVLLEEIPFEPFEMSISGIGAFPNNRYPSVIWAGAEEHPEMMKLQNEISEKLAGYMPRVPVKPFHPHITLARVKDKKRLNDKKIFSLKTDPLKFPAKGFSLKRSVLQPEGAVHEVIKSYP